MDTVIYHLIGTIIPSLDAELMWCALVIISTEFMAVLYILLKAFVAHGFKLKEMQKQSEISLRLETNKHLNSERFHFVKDLNKKVLTHNRNFTYVLKNESSMDSKEFKQALELSTQIQESIEENEWLFEDPYTRFVLKELRKSHLACMAAQAFMALRETIFFTINKNGGDVSKLKAEWKDLMSEGQITIPEDIKNVNQHVIQTVKASI